MPARSVDSIKCDRIDLVPMRKSLVDMLMFCVKDTLILNEKLLRSAEVRDSLQVKAMVSGGGANSLVLHLVQHLAERIEVVLGHVVGVGNQLVVKGQLDRRNAHRDQVDGVDHVQVGQLSIHAL